MGESKKLKLNFSHQINKVEPKKPPKQTTPSVNDNNWMRSCGLWFELYETNLLLAKTCSYWEKTLFYWIHPEKLVH